MAMLDEMTLLDALGRSIGLVASTPFARMASAVRQTVSRFPRLQLATTPVAPGCNCSCGAEGSRACSRAALLAASASFVAASLYRRPLLPSLTSGLASPVEVDDAKSPRSPSVSERPGNS